MANFLDEKRSEIDRRLKELKPLHEEYILLERAKAALEGVDGEQQPTRRGPGRPRGTGGGGRTRGGGGRGGRRGRRGGTTDAALAFIRQNPGATVREVADGIGLKHPNYLYRVLSGLQEQGAVRKEGKGWAAA
jgi:hypothetical protein